MLRLGFLGKGQWSDDIFSHLFKGKTSDEIIAEQAKTHTREACNIEKKSDSLAWVSFSKWTFFEGSRAPCFGGVFGVLNKDPKLHCSGVCPEFPACFRWTLKNHRNELNSKMLVMNVWELECSKHDTAWWNLWQEKNPWIPCKLLPCSRQGDVVIIFYGSFGGCHPTLHGLFICPWKSYQQSTRRPGSRFHLLSPSRKLQVSVSKALKDNIQI